MRFRLVTLFVLITVLAAFCGIIFAAPLWITALTLAVTMLLSPAVWVAGWSYAKGGRQAFFRGGLVCGILPYLVACFYMISMFGAVIADFPNMAETLEDAGDPGWVRLAYVVMWITPGVFSFLGGSVSYLVYRLLTPRTAVSKRSVRASRSRRNRRLVQVQPQAAETELVAGGSERPLPR